MTVGNANLDLTRSKEVNHVRAPNAIAARAGLDDFTRGDPETLGDLFADDIVWHAPGDNPSSGTFVGKEATMDG